MDQDAEGVWERVKRWVAAYAASDRPLPDDEECENAVRQIVHRELLNRSIDEQMIEFYSAEACTMIGELRHVQNIGERAEQQQV